jgi:hypothetical protein
MSQNNVSLKIQELEDKYPGKFPRNEDASVPLKVTCKYCQTSYNDIMASRMNPTFGHKESCEWVQKRSQISLLKSIQ